MRRAVCGIPVRESPVGITLLHETLKAVALDGRVPDIPIGLVPLSIVGKREEMWGTYERSICVRLDVSRIVQKQGNLSNTEVIESILFDDN